MKAKLLGFIERFRGKRILVIGDIMLDKYLNGDVSRISPEAPVPIVTVKNERFVPGGAANVACNIASLGGNAVMAGVIGKDEPGTLLMKELQERGIETSQVIVDRKKPTTQKVRVVAEPAIAGLIMKTQAISAMKQRWSLSSQSARRFQESMLLSFLIMQKESSPRSS